MGRRSRLGVGYKQGWNKTEKGQFNCLPSIYHGKHTEVNYVIDTGIDLCACVIHQSSFNANRLNRFMLNANLRCIFSFTIIGL